MPSKRRCRKCGCTDNNACVTNGIACHWVEADLCSACAGLPADAVHVPERLWLPADWLDEVNPTMLPSPDDFIEKQADVWFLRLPKDDPDRENEFYRMSVVPGQVVSFNWMESYGEIGLVVNADGSFVADIQTPARATHFYEPQTGTIAYNLDQLVKGDPECSIYEPLEPGDYEVMTYTWSDAVFFRFDVDAEGKGVFVPCGGPN